MSTRMAVVLCFFAACARADSPRRLSNEDINRIAGMDATSIYAVTSLSTYHRLIAIARRDGSVTELGAKVPAPLRLAVFADGNNVVYSSRLETYDYPAPLMRAPLAGGAAVQIAPAGFYGGFVRAGEELFFYDDDKVRRMPRNGGEIRAVADYVHDFAIGGGWIYLAEGSSIMRHALAGDAREDLFSTETVHRPRGFLADANAVYWSDGDAIYSASAAKGWKPIELYRAAAEHVVKLEAANSKELFLFLRRPKTIWHSLLRLPKHGGAPSVISAQCDDVAADDNGVFYLEIDDKQAHLMRSP